MNQNDAFSRDPTKPVAPAFLKQSDVVARTIKRQKRTGMMPNREVAEMLGEPARKGAKRKGG